MRQCLFFFFFYCSLDGYMYLQIQKVLSRKQVLEEVFAGNKTWQDRELKKTLERMYQFSWPRGSKATVMQNTQSFHPKILIHINCWIHYSVHHPEIVSLKLHQNYFTVLEERPYAHLSLPYSPEGLTGLLSCIDDWV